MVSSPAAGRVVLVIDNDEETTMNKLITTSTLGLAGLVATGLVAWQAPMALGDDADDRPTHSGKAFMRDDDSQVLVTTVDDDDDDDTGLNHQTRTRTRGGDDTGTNTGTRTRGGNTDHSRGGSVCDLTSDGPGSGNVDRSRHHTNDGTRHNTRGR
jgi:hypothetical protein